MLVFGVAPVLAPLVGGQILTVAGWRGIFAALVAYGVFCMAATLGLPETLPRERRRAAGMHDLLASYGQVLAHGPFMGYAAASAFAAGALLAYISASPDVVIEQFGVSAQLFGLVFGANALGLVAASQLTARVVGRLGTETVLRRAVLVQTLAALALVGLAAAGMGGLWALLAPMFFVVASIGAIMPTSSALALTPFPHAAGAASAVLGTLQAGIGALAVVLVSAIALAPATTMGAVLVGACLLSSGVLLLVPHQRAAEVAPDTAPLA
jgi:DHA1 family bicyclomycin/chloramphenicol resistance-like MFS transporter